jgi:hypothetical protein
VSVRASPRRLAVPVALALVVALGAACAAAPSAPSDPSAIALAPTATSTPTSRPTATPDAILEGEPPAPAAPVASTPAATPSPTATPLPPAEPFAINLFRKGDFVAQYTFEWCVGASIQMTLAMTDTSADLSRSRQQRVWELARDRSSSPFGGANPRGWVAALNELGVGPYELVSVPDRDGAIRVAARALLATGRPVGLVMWRGRHAWVMSGFEATADPRIHEDFRVTGIRVQDPLYPHGSSRWGASPKPNSLLTPDELGRQFVPRTSGRVNLGVPPGYLLVLPRVATA